VAPEFPQVFVFDATDDENDAGDDLARRVRDLGISAPFVLSSVHGKKLASRLEGPQPPATHAGGADQIWAAELGARAKRSGADAVVAVGGGRCIDVGKLAAARAGLGLVTVPTQLSHDGICSPVAVVPDESGRTESLGAVVPRAVFVSIPTLVDAPPDSLRAGLGDLLANPFALKDWKLAAEHGLDTLDQRSWDLSVQSFELVEPHLDDDRLGARSDPELLRRLADALVLSGMAMICAGTSRPASGGEHEISHAIDELFGGRALHGAQVAFGCIFSAALYDEDAGEFRARVRRLGLPDNPGDLGLDIDDTARLLLAAPGTRPGRFTILENADLDDSAARALIGRIWEEN
jgi:glycerol-1-phosphate dehydrogenase [NAD(P)+]